MTVIVGSRGSSLALTQTKGVIRQLEAKHPDVRFSLKIISTAGDRHTTPMALGTMDKGWFVKELEEALLKREIDLAIHSLKDLPTEQPKGLEVSVISEREDPRDVLVAPGVGTLRRLAPGAVVGTSSLRRKVQLAAFRRDLEYREIKGNVDTRLAKVDRGEYQAVVLAMAGLKRLGLGHRPTEVFSTDDLIPAPGQGALGLETRRGDDRVIRVANVLDHRPTRWAVEAERACLAGLGGGCRMPIGVYAEIKKKTMTIRGVYADDAGTRVVREALSGEATQAQELGHRLAEMLLDKFRQ